MDKVLILILIGIILILLILYWKKNNDLKKTELFLTERADSESRRCEAELKSMVEIISSGVSKGEIPCGIIIAMTGGCAYCSAYAAELLDWPPELAGFGDACGTVIDLLGKVKPGIEEGCDTVALIKNGSIVWMEICRHWRDKDMIVTVRNVTDVVEAKKRDLYAKRHDLLTGFFNHRTFVEKLKELFSEKERIGIACIVFFKLESLEILNDNYGFMYVDEYIKFFTDTLRDASPAGSIFSRYSASEFLGFFYGYPSESSLRQTIEKLFKTIKNSSAALGEHQTEVSLKATAGIAWYPKDSEDAAELLTYANFAAYIGQKTAAERLMEYDRERYQKDGYLINSRESFQRLIENKLVKYAFQPIVDIATAKIYGYEMLIRPQIPELSNPEDVLNLARIQSKLYIIESITWFEGMRTFTEQVERGLIPYNVKVFINSIGGTMLSGEERMQFYEKFYDYMKNLVIEITEADQNDDDIIGMKRDMARQWNAQIAVDDYGSGYNSELSLLYFQPDIVKVDMTIVQGVDHDEDRLNILKNLIQYAHQRDIRVVAEGVQTKEEMQTVVACGVDYVQGYYLAKPDYLPRDITAKQKQEIGRMKHGI
ncbi:MAG: EAL domain-containing protein [Clostridia bacterium]|nr:EAL domain-containing protein [Clostridia bacterium]